MNTAVMFGKATDEWQTPRALFEALDAEFGFDVDVAATEENRWKDTYCGLDHHRADRRDGLAIPWGDNVCWMNPPYSRCREFIAKAAQEARRGATVVALVPSRTDTRWWHSDVWDADKHTTRPGVEIRFVKGRLKFGGHNPADMTRRHGNNSAPFPSVVVIFRPVA